MPRRFHGCRFSPSAILGHPVGGRRVLPWTFISDSPSLRPPGSYVSFLFFALGLYPFLMACMTQRVTESRKRPPIARTAGAPATAEAMITSITEPTLAVYFLIPFPLSVFRAHDGETELFLDRIWSVRLVH